MKKIYPHRLLAQSLLFTLIFSSFPSSFAAEVSDPTDLYISDLSIGDYSMKLTFTAGNQGGEAGYAGFKSEGEIGKVVRNTYTLKQGSTTLYTLTQEWQDPNSQASAYRYTNSKASIENTQFANYVENLLVNGQTYQIEVCLDSGAKVPEVSDGNNCASATVVYSPNPTGDADGDGLTNQEEGYLDLDPYDPDTDGDGLTDSNEIALTLTDPHEYDTYTGDSVANDYDYDTDGDGLSNGYEIYDWAAVGTLGNFVGEGANPLNPDTDEDSLGDLWEVTYTSYGESNYCPLDVSYPDGDHDGTLDTDEDCDGDDLSNLDEYGLGTSPISADSDGDGYADGVEVSEASDPLDANSIPYTAPTLDPNGDEDGDGLKNSLEEYYGTDLYDSDTDNDFYTDYEEVSVSRPSNPLSASSTPADQYDTDGDRIKDLFDKDDDGDGRMDRYELSVGTNPRNARE